jgi:hypothetical protein
LGKIILGKIILGKNSEYGAGNCGEKLYGAGKKYALPLFTRCFFDSQPGNPHYHLTKSITVDMVEV